VTPRDRLARASALDPASVKLSPHEAAEAVGVDPSPSQIRLNTFDGRPVYRFSGGRGGGRVVYADTGEEQRPAPRSVRDRVAIAWTGQPASRAVVQSIQDVDQWTLLGLRNVRPLWKYSWPNGEQLYIGESGEVLQYTTRGSRLAAYLGAIPHWMYFTPLRKHQVPWLRFMIWSSAIGTFAALIGIVIGVWRYSPSKKYRFDGTPSSLPYRGQKWWHAVFGLVFGVATVTWTFSGLMSLDPFPRVDPRGQQAARATQGPGVPGALRGRVQMEDFAASHPSQVLARHPELQVKELRFTSFVGWPLYVADLGDGTARTLTLEGEAIDEFDRQLIIDTVKSVATDPDAMETTLITEYDLYYLDRRRQQPLPVMLFRMNDADNTRYYIDPKTATVVGGYSDRAWSERWLFSGLHSLNFPWLYNNRPLWDIVVIGFMVGGTALCVTSLVLAWRVLGRKLAWLATRSAGSEVRAAES
jgi:hypothetical protein